MKVNTKQWLIITTIIIMMWLVIATPGNGQVTHHDDVVVFKAKISQLDITSNMQDAFGAPLETAEDMLNTYQFMDMVVNAGMYMQQNWWHVGYLEINNKEQSPKNRYSSVLCLDPIKQDGKPGIYTLDSIFTLDKLSRYYGTLIQNLQILDGGQPAWEGGRDVKFGGISLATKRHDPHHIYFIAHTQPRTGKEIAELHLSLGMWDSQHLEGGPEAQLSYTDHRGDVHTILTCYEKYIFESFDCGDPIAVPFYFYINNRK